MESLPREELGEAEDVLPPPYGSEAEPGFDGEPGFEDLPGPAEAPAVIPFTGQELADGTAMLLMLGLRLQSPEEVEAFRRAFQSSTVLPPAQVLDALKVGEALAHYGIGRNRLPGSLDAMPPWLRILLGGAILAAAAYGGVRAAMEVRANRVSPANAASTGEAAYA